jgi:hypothetical protein
MWYEQATMPSSWTSTGGPTFESTKLPLDGVYVLILRLDLALGRALAPLQLHQLVPQLGLLGLLPLHAQSEAPPRKSSAT